MADSCPDRRARLSSRKLNGAALLVVYYQVNHTTRLSFLQRPLVSSIGAPQRHRAIGLSKFLFLGAFGGKEG